jgi:DNA-directed RNA polymerase specialized sigma24 family protein
MVSDEALRAEFRGGSREAFEELFARYRDPLHGFFRRRLESRKRAEDLIQETFLAVWTQRPGRDRSAVPAMEVPPPFATLALSGANTGWHRGS